MSKRVKLIFRLAVTLALFVLLSRLIDWRSFWQQITQANPVWAAAGVGFILLNYFIGAKRWQVLLNHASVGWGKLLYLYFLGAFFNNFLPSSIGGDGYKMYRVAALTGRKAEAVTSVFMDRVTGLFALFCLSVVGLVSFWGWRGLWLLVIFVAAAVGGFWFLGKAAKLHPFLDKIYQALRAYRHRRKDLLKAWGLSFGVQIGSVLAQVSAFYALGIKVPLAYSFFVLPLVNFIAFLPISVNGLGVQDGLFAFAYAPVGIATESAVAASLLYHALRFGVSLIGGLFYASENFQRPRELGEK